jgi:hypothetical protein
MSYFLVKIVLKNLVPFKKFILFLMFEKVLCYNHVCMEMIFLCVIIMTICVIIFYPLLNDLQKALKMIKISKINIFIRSCSLFKSTIN